MSENYTSSLLMNRHTASVILHTTSREFATSAWSEPYAKMTAAKALCSAPLTYYTNTLFWIGALQNAFQAIIFSERSKMLTCSDFPSPFLSFLENKTLANRYTDWPHTSRSCYKCMTRLTRKRDLHRKHCAVHQLDTLLWCTVQNSLLCNPPCARNWSHMRANFPSLYFLQYKIEGIKCKQVHVR